MSYEEDFPPVVTVPFDPFLGDIALRVRCPGLNQRNTLTTTTNNIRCVVPKYISPTVFTFVKGNKNLSCMASSTTADILGMKRCNTQNAFKFTLATRMAQSRFSCRTFMSMGQQTSRKTGPCAIKSASNVVFGSFQPCRWNGKVYPVLPFLTKRICPKTARSLPTIVSTIGFRRYCGTYPLDMKVSRYLCRSRPYTLGQYTPVTRAVSNASWPCRISEIYDYTLYTTKRPCNPTVLGLNLPVNNGAKNNLGKNCKLVDVLSTSVGQSICHNFGIIMPAALTYRSANLGICRLYPLLETTGRRWRCGTILLAELDLSVYGRVWGSTFQLPQYYQDFINNQFVRQTGRMMGKIRN